MSVLIRFGLIAGFALALGACGNKGDLVMPTKKAPAAAPATPAKDSAPKPAASP